MPLADAQLAEDGSDEIALDHRGFWVSVGA